MTIGWGFTGCVWRRPAACVLVRPSRYTMQFMEENECYSINCFGGKAREMLAEMGTKSGRDIDKMHYPGLTASFTHEAPFFEEAELVLICRKMYAQKMEPDLFTGDYGTDILDQLYGGSGSPKDLHTIYYGEIIHALSREEV